MQQVAVLFARADSVYKTLPGCDVWDIERDARNWEGGSPVVAHPPCRAWGGLSHMAKPRVGERELAPWAVDKIRQFGGVLEHPVRSRLWREKLLPEPGLVDAFGGWTLIIPQYWFGHQAQKMTRLYIVGCAPARLPTIPMTLGQAPYVVATSGKRKDGSRSGYRPEIPKADREHTPIQLAQWLVEVARRCATVSRASIEAIDNF